MLFKQQQSDKNDIFVNNIRLNNVDKKDNKQTPHVNTKVSAYDRVVQLVTNDNTEVKQQIEEPKKRYTCVLRLVSLLFAFFCCFNRYDAPQS